MWASEIGQILVADTGLRSLMVSSAVLLGLVLLGCAGVYLVRWWLKNGSQPADNEPFTLDQLRSLYRAGDLSEDEYGRAKSKLLARVQGKIADSEALQPEPEDPGKPPTEEGRPSS